MNEPYITKKFKAYKIIMNGITIRSYDDLESASAEYRNLFNKEPLEYARVKCQWRCKDGMNHVHEILIPYDRVQDTLYQVK